MADKPTVTSVRKEIGATGTVMFGGIITDTDYNRELSGERGLRMIDKMRKGDATVRAAFLVVTLPILATNWFVEAASDDEADVRAKEFIEKQLFEEMSITWLDFLRETLLYLAYGRYVWEIVYKDVVFDGVDYIGLQKLSPRLPATITHWQTKDKQNGITQFTVEKGEVSIPIEKLIIFTYEKEGDNWEGTSIFRSAYKNWYIKDNLYKIDAIAHERQGLGVPYVKRQDGSGASKKDQNKARDILQGLRANEKGYLDIPQNWDVGFMDMKVGSTKDSTKSISHHDRQIVKSVLAQFIELGATSSGSYALGADQSDIFILALNSIAEQVKNTAQKYLVDRVVDINFQSPNGRPQINYTRLGKKDIEKLSAALQRVVQVGLVMPDEELETYIRNVFDLPEKPEFTDLPEDFMQDDLMDLEMAMGGLEGSVGGPEVPGSEDGVTDEDVQQAAEMLQPFLGAKGPLSDEHKKRISEALKRYWSTRKKTKSSGGGSKKKASPEVTAKKGAISELRNELSAFRDNIKRERLERVARGEKLSTEEKAKLQLQLLDKKQEIQQKIDALRGEIEELQTASEGFPIFGSEGRAAFLGMLSNFRDTIREVAESVQSKLSNNS